MAETGEETMETDEQKEGDETETNKNADEDGENDGDADEEQEDREEEEGGENEEQEGVEEKVSDNPYDRMVKSLTNRASNKRKVKLIENQLSNFVFGGSDSEDDEDYTVGDEEMRSDDDDSDGKEDENADAGSDGSSDEDDGKSYNLLDLLRSYEAGGKSDSENDEQTAEPDQAEEGVEEGDADGDGKADDSFEQDTTVIEGGDAVKGTTKRNDILRSNRLYKKNVLVCGVCLESDENEGDEIVECDNCGITVHEGCYGDFDLDYDNKSVSDDLTEPWFCEPCKGEITTDLLCELCPTKGGVYKQTDTGKWVHLICALYTPYVGFRDVVKLQIVVLEDIKKEMWGKKECTFCTDENFSKTGVCIGCDSGLCKTVFHVTCGQKHGFLSDIPDRGEPNDETQDFLFAHCKLHTMKARLKKRKISWLAYRARVSKFKLSDDPEEKERITVALYQARLEYKSFRRNLIPPKQLPQEFPRMLSSCPEACMMLARKAEMLEMDLEPGYNISSAVVAGKISKHEANLSEDFVNYFFKREMQLKELQLSIDQGEPNLSKLEDQQKMLMKKSENYHSKLEKVLHAKEILTKSCKDLHDLLCKLADKTLKLPKVLRPKHANLMTEKMEQSVQLLNSIVHRCEICKSTDNQQFLAHCGTCSRYYHMDCLDPPLSRLPRKSDKYVWQCHSCDTSDKSESDDTEGPITVLVTDEHGVVRRKRPNKEPDKYTETPKEKIDKKDDDKSSKDAENKTPKEKKRSHKRRIDEVKSKEVIEDDSKNGSVPEDEIKAKKRKSAVKKDERPERAERPERSRVIKKENVNETVEDDDKGKKEKDKEALQKKKKNEEPKVSPCFVCKTLDDPKLVVKCDECGRCYHFLTCINPPYHKNPKVSKFWAWFCEECDNSDEQSIPTDDKRESKKPEILGAEDPDKKKKEKANSTSEKRQCIDSPVTTKPEVTKSGKNKSSQNIDRVGDDMKEIKKELEPVVSVTKCKPDAVMKTSENKENSQEKIVSEEEPINPVSEDKQPKNDDDNKEIVNNDTPCNLNEKVDVPTDESKVNAEKILEKEEQIKSDDHELKETNVESDKIIVNANDLNVPKGSQSTNDNLDSIKSESSSDKHNSEGSEMGSETVDEIKVSVPPQIDDEESKYLLKPSRVSTSTEFAQAENISNKNDSPKNKSSDEKSLNIDDKDLNIDVNKTVEVKPKILEMKDIQLDDNSPAKTIMHQSPNKPSKENEENIKITPKATESELKDGNSYLGKIDDHKLSLLNEDKKNQSDKLNSPDKADKVISGNNPSINTVPKVKSEDNNSKSAGNVMKPIFLDIGERVKLGRVRTQVEKYSPLLSPNKVSSSTNKASPNTKKISPNTTKESPNTKKISPTTSKASSITKKISPTSSKASPNTKKVSPNSGKASPSTKVMSPRAEKKVLADSNLKSPSKTNNGASKNTDKKIEMTSPKGKKVSPDMKSPGKVPNDKTSKVLGSTDSKSPIKPKSTSTISNEEKGSTKPKVMKDEKEKILSTTEKKLPVQSNVKSPIAEEKVDKTSLCPSKTLVSKKEVPVVHIVHQDKEGRDEVFELKPPAKESVDMEVFGEDY